MTRQTLRVLAGVLAFSAASAANAVMIELRVSVTTGNVSIVNTGPETAVFDAYEIVSASNELLPDGWLSIDENYDLSGDQSVDAISEWTELNVGFGSLAEGSLSPLSGELAAGESVLLGPIWTPSGVGDLTLEFLAGATSTLVSPVFVLEGDINRDQIVDASDFAALRDLIPSTGIGAPGDADANGVVEPADLAIPRQQFGGTNPFAPLAAPAASPILVVTPLTVPEPAAASGLAAAILLGGSAIRRRRATA